MSDIPLQRPRPYRLGLTIAAMLGAVGCVSPKAVQAPPPPAPVAVIRPGPPATTDWRDIPLTPGDWRYAAAPGGSAATFGANGAATFVARCDLAARAITLSRDTPTPAAATMVITTSAGNRALAALPAAGPSPAILATLPARDPFLDKMAFSRGRFVIAITGTARLVIPAWPEFARVIEDCRG